MAGLRRALLACGDLFGECRIIGYGAPASGGGHSSRF
jgi:hypothetical protein